MVRPRAGRQWAACISFHGASSGSGQPAHIFMRCVWPGVQRGYSPGGHLWVSKQFEEDARTLKEGHREIQDPKWSLKNAVVVTDTIKITSWKSTKDETTQYTNRISPA